MNEPGTPFSVTVNSAGKQRQRHGMLWTMSELRTMRDLFWQGADLNTLCDVLHRSPNGVLPKLVQEGCIEAEDDGGYTCLEPCQDPYNEPEPYPPTQGANHGNQPKCTPDRKENGRAQALNFADRQRFPTW